VSVLSRSITYLNDKVFQTVVGNHWMKLGDLEQYEPRCIEWDAFEENSIQSTGGLKFLVVTPSLNQSPFIERTINSVIKQNFGALKYIVKDGGSIDKTAEILRKYRDNGYLEYSSTSDLGQSSAINSGFEQYVNSLDDHDVMAWINSDDIYAPNAFNIVGEFFKKRPDVDVVYGHRIIINSFDLEIGRWILPPHCSETIKWVDYIPQETLFWRKRAWKRVGGLDESFQFAMDWDLILRFQESGAVIQRIPYFLGAFRIHTKQKTSSILQSIGASEIDTIRSRFVEDRSFRPSVEKSFKKILFWGSIYTRMLNLGFRI